MSNTPIHDQTEKIADKLGHPMASYGFALATLKQTEIKFNEAIAHRDRLADALELARDRIYYHAPLDRAIDTITQALAAVKQPTKNETL